MINQRFFFDQVRGNLFQGKLSASQAKGLSAILDEWEKSYAAKDDRWLAYALATTHHETARTMLPIHEFGGNAYFHRMYDKNGSRPKVAKELGNTEAGDGVRFHGRGYVQLTGRRNYKRMGDVVGANLVSDPDKAMDPTIATRILFEGMASGFFTGKKLPDYFNKNTENWIEARRIINRLDKAEMIAGYGKKYYAAISHTV